VAVTLWLDGLQPAQVGSVRHARGLLIEMLKESEQMKLLILVPLFVAVVALVIWLVQALWNAVMPDVFTGLHAITYWQAAGLSLLSSLLIRAGTTAGK
jgi:NAD/NADP transhydrogenase beta subunit